MVMVSLTHALTALTAPSGVDMVCGTDTTSKRSIQVGLADSLLSTKRLKLDRDLSKAILYQGNCSHGILTENPHLKRTIRELAEDAGLGAYAPPNRYRVSNELLEYHYNQTKSTIEQRFLCADTDGMVPRVVTISFDGWDNASRTHVLGVMAISRVGPVFHKAIDTTGVALMGKEWTIEQIKSLVTEFGGPERVIGTLVQALESGLTECVVQVWYWTHLM